MKDTPVRHFSRSYSASLLVKHLRPVRTGRKYKFAYSTPGQIHILMLSAETENRLCALIKAIADNERELETQRQLLASKSQFEPYAAFMRLDRLRKDNVTVFDLRDFLQYFLRSLPLGTTELRPPPTSSTRLCPLSRATRAPALRTGNS